jgi:DNA repair exonuclease SbcCD nuclease subunit
MTNPLFVAISDIHFSVPNLELASKSLQAALSKAEELNIPLVIAGDLNDTKAIIRAEVANSIILILKPAKVKVYILEGNHDKVNEKGKEHGLNYLRPYADILDMPHILQVNGKAVFVIPYQSDSEAIIGTLNARPLVPKLVIMHQGFRGAFMGDYIQDKSSIPVDVFKNHTVISGHYHRHQTLGTITYIGSPYTITYGEANDGPKGFLVVNEDGTFTREILKLRKHIIVERKIDDNLENPVENYNLGDLVKLKLTGSRKSINNIDKHKLGLKLIGHNNFSLDLIVEEIETTQKSTQLNLTDHELMLQLIRHKQPSLENIYLEILNEIDKSKA